MDKQTAQWINALVQIIGEKVLEGGQHDVTCRLATKQQNL